MPTAQAVYTKQTVHVKLKKNFAPEDGQWPTNWTHDATVYTV
jgi:hypothetical protein